MNQIVAAIKNFSAPLLIGCIILCTGHAWAQNSGRLVELEVYSNSTTPVTLQHQWLEALSQVRADRVTSKTARTPRSGIEETTFDGSTVITVKGVIKNRKLKLPGKTFSITDTRGIAGYLKDLRADGAKTTLAEKKAFGLTSEQLVDVHAKLTPPLSGNTTSEKSGPLIRRLVPTLPLRTNLSAAADAATASQTIVDNQYDGLSVGTVLSIELRRHDLVLRPVAKRGRGVELEIVSTASATESWPPGWPSESAPVTAFPKLFEVTALQLNNIQLDSVLNAIKRRLKIEFIVDPAAWGGRPVELSKVKVTYNKNRSSYAAAISNILSQSKPQLRYEIRLDENSTPFLWVTKL